MELRHLRYFVTLADELSFTRAARRLNMAQPPLSQQIQQLERDLGVLLFHRTNRKVELTYAGQVFLREARAALDQVENAISAARRADGREFGSITVGAGVVPIYSVICTVVSGFHEAFPGVDFHLRELLPHDQTSLLRNRGIDVGFVIPPVNAPDLASEVVFEDALVAVLPTEHRLSKKRSITPLELQGERFIMPDRAWAPTYFDYLIALCRDAGFSPNIVHLAREFQSMMALVGAGLGTALVPSSMRLVGVEGLAPVLVRPASLPVQMMWRPSENNPVVAAFLDLVRSSVRARLLA